MLNEDKRHELETIVEDVLNEDDCETVVTWQAQNPIPQEVQPIIQVEQQPQTLEESIKEKTNAAINELKSSLDILLTTISNVESSPQMDFMSALIINDISSFNMLVNEKLSLINQTINREQKIKQVNLKEPMIISVPMNQL